MKTVSLDDVYEAKKVVEPVAFKTDMKYSRSSSKRAGTEIFLKSENEQLTGSFKIRGAINKITSLTEEQRKKGVIASSAGNHAQGVAYSATHLGAKSVIVMPEQAPLVKVTATKSYGAEVILHGAYYDEAESKARELEKEKGYTFVHPYNDPKVIAGQGTIGLEVIEQLPDLDSIIVPIGGGGLISGIATVIKSLKPECKVYGVQPKAANGMSETFLHKELRQSPEKILTIADGVAVKKPTIEIYEKYISKLVDDVITVSEEDIAEGIVFLMERAKTVVEGASALSFAAACSGKLDLGKKSCLVLCGGNIDLNTISKVVERGLVRSGRRADLSVAIVDSPGTLSRLTKILSDNKVNILEVHHDRNHEGLYMGEAIIDFVLETRDRDQIEQIKKAFKEEGCRLV